MKNQMKKGKSKNSKARWTPPALQALKYTGPIEPPIELAAELPIAGVLRDVFTITSSPTGAYNTIYSNSPSSAPDWTDYAALYQRYRVLGMKLRLVPFNNNWGNTAALAQATGAFVMYTVRDVTVTGPTSYPTAVNFSNATLRSTQQELEKEIRMDGATDAAWLETNSPAPTFGIGLFALGLTMSSVYGQVEISYLVEFYGRT